MSIQFGEWHLNGEPFDEHHIHRLDEFLSRYGPDGGNCYRRDDVSILYRALHTTKESRQETQPLVLISDTVLTWDGRLDNRSELIHETGKELSIESTDISIVAFAYERWGTDSFARLVGDWALSVWDPTHRSLILAKDPVGVRSLYYSCNSNRITWCTVLDPLLFFADHSFELDQEYVAGWLRSFPDPQLTPYLGVHSVAPSCFVQLQPGKRRIVRYWDFDSARQVRYRTDADYEERFRAAFTNSVKRRLRSDSPVLAELSGGIDSSSIVCVADAITSRGCSEAPRLNTLSYYDDSEPNWDERPYFTRVEQKRGRTGVHIDISSRDDTPLEFATTAFAALPPLGMRPCTATAQFAEAMVSEHHRVLLSGIGGDEVTGGVPTARPELEDLLATGQLKRLAHQLKLWALNKRKPWTHLLLEAIQQFTPLVLLGPTGGQLIPVWLHSHFVKQQRNALTGYETRLKFLGPLPSFQENISTLNSLRGQIGCWAPSSDPPYERRYPFLDRDLLEFLFAIPREQLVRPGQRRSLVRRALAGIVPDEVLNRKRKAFVARAPILRIASHWSRLLESDQPVIAASSHIIDRGLFGEAVAQSRRGLDTHAVELLRTIILEYWLRNVTHRHFLAVSQSCKQESGADGGQDQAIACVAEN